MKHFQTLYEALASLVIEIDPDEKIVDATGDAQRHFGVETKALVGKEFSGLLQKSDVSLWRLVHSKLEKTPAVGPIPLRARNENPDSGGRSSIELFAVKGENGQVQVAVNTYHGQITMAQHERPPSSFHRPIQQSDFAVLGQKLSTYAAVQGMKPEDALIQLAGINNDNKRGFDFGLWTLYRFLHDSVSDRFAEEESKAGFSASAQSAKSEAEATREKTGSEENVKHALKTAYNEGKKRGVNYIDVAGQDGISESEAVKAAVYALQSAAKSGKARTLDALTGNYEKRLAQTKDHIRAFKQIVVQERFDVALQPIVDIKTGILHHYEALARFDPQFYSGSPFEFMCFAEDIGIIHEFDLAMTMKVISQIKRLRRIGYNISVAVNLSGRSIQSKAFLRNFFNLLEDCGDIRQNLKFELTESSEIEDLTTTNRILSRIRDFGHKVCLDDFGAGAAGLQYLRVLKVDYVKIDGIYVQRALENKDDQAFLRTITDLCKSLGTVTVGECVETEEQQKLLTDIGVSYGQGWLYGKPEPVEQALRHL